MVDQIPGPREIVGLRATKAGGDELGYRSS